MDTIKLLYGINPSPNFIRVGCGKLEKYGIVRLFGLNPVGHSHSATHAFAKKKHTIGRIIVKSHESESNVTGVVPIQCAVLAAPVVKAKIRACMFSSTTEVPSSEYTATKSYACISKIPPRKTWYAVTPSLVVSCATCMA